MTYSSGGLIQATDYNGFVSTTAGANINATWSTGSGNAGWGQTAINTVAAGGTVTAAQWATLVANLATMGSQTGTTITARTQPVAGNIISVLNNVNTDITNCYTNRGNAVASGTAYGTFTGAQSKTTATGSGQTTWTITFTHTVTFPSANQARYFFNAGGIVKLQYGKTSTGTDIDPDWNTFAGLCGSINITGGAQTIAGQAYTGTTRLGGTGGTQTTLATTTGWYALTVSPTTIFQLNNATSPYTGEYIRTTATATSTTVLTLVTTWVQPAVSDPGTTCNISGGTAVASPATVISPATAPTTLCTYIPPSTTYLTNSWGTPTIAGTVA
jgi:hypothetical protein